jgi:apolipoprotein N-acyltransferase
MPKGSSSIAALAERVRSLSGWRQRLAALAAGAASVLAMAPFFVWPLLWATLPALVWLIDGSVRRHAAAGRLRTVAAAAETGWWWGFGYFLAGLYWLGEAFLVEAEVFAVLMPFAVTLMPAGLALFYGAATALAAPLWKSGVWRVVGLALALSAMEWLRGHVLSGFPWNLLGYALTYPVELMQTAALLGVYGLTLLAVLVFGLPAVLLSEIAQSGSRQWGGRWAALGVAVLPIALAGVLGFARMTQATSDTVPGVKIRLVQPSVPQREKWRPENWARFFQDHLDLSAQSPSGAPDGLAGVTHVIWPEAAMPFPVLDYADATAAIGNLLPERTVLIAGAIRIEWSPSEPRRPQRFFNSLFVFGKAGLIALYDKIRLVPFGEFLPLRPLLSALGLREIASREGYSSGIEPRPLLEVPGLSAVVPLICYEAVFPGAVVQGPQRPTLIVTLTNDGWFGNSTGPRQHLHQARVRAVEEGLPLVRAANNGVSAAFDAYGRSLGQIDLNVRGTLDVPLALPLAPPPYARFGDGIFLLGWMAVAAFLSWRVWRQ